MEVLRVTGGKPLKGQVRASGAKNAMTKLLVASLISDKKCTFHNVPNIGDVEITLAMCKEIGMEATWDKESPVAIALIFNSRAKVQAKRINILFKMIRRYFSWLIWLISEKRG